MFPASTTKILTALTAIEYTAPEYEYYVGSELGLVAQDSSMSWIAEGSSLCRNEILTAMLAPSGNDAAYTIAVNVARKLYGDDISDNDAVAYFAVLMNDYAKKLGAKIRTLQCRTGITMMNIIPRRRICCNLQLRQRRARRYAI